MYCEDYKCQLCIFLLLPYTGVSIGIYASVLHALGLLDGLEWMADIGNDGVGQALVSAELPRHVHLKRKIGPSRDG